MRALETEEDSRKRKQKALEDNEDVLCSLIESPPVTEVEIISSVTWTNDQAKCILIGQVMKMIGHYAFINICQLIGVSLSKPH